VIVEFACFHFEKETAQIKHCKQDHANKKWRRLSFYVASEKNFSLLFLSLVNSAHLLNSPPSIYPPCIYLLTDEEGFTLHEHHNQKFFSSTLKSNIMAKTEYYQFIPLFEKFIGDSASGCRLQKSGSLQYR